jgi:hypothetical protein
MALQGFNKVFHLKAVAYRVIHHWLPVDVFVENSGVDSAEVNGAGLRGQSGNQSGVVGVHVSEHEICFRQINIKSAQTFLHSLKTNTAVESCIDNQVPVIGLDDV